MQPDMWSGWGIRTLSANNPAYNPYSYQRGSVWPHDNGIIALGFKRYGFAAEAARDRARRLRRGELLHAATSCPSSMPASQRDVTNFPVQYLGANVPQAWAAGSVFTLLQAMLGLAAGRAAAAALVDPALPDWLPERHVARPAARRGARSTCASGATGRKPASPCSAATRSSSSPRRMPSAEAPGG